MFLRVTATEVSTRKTTTIVEKKCNGITKIGYLRKHVVADHKLVGRNDPELGVYFVVGKIGRL